MSSEKQSTGTIGWCDLTVPDAERVRDFYASVVGWKTQAVEMDGYHDYCMVPPAGDEPAAGVCHARGANSKLPAQWLIYIRVENLTVALQRCVQQGGAVVDGPRSMVGQQVCVIRDPAGAHVALVGAS